MDTSVKIMNVYFLSLHVDTIKRGFWDMGIVEDLLAEYPKLEVGSLPPEDYAVVVIPARSHADVIDEINHELSKINGVVLMAMGDEENVFPVEKINHPNIRIWVQNPRPGRHDIYTRLGTGYPQHIHDHMTADAPDKYLDWYFAGQITHVRREEAAEQMRRMSNGILVESKSFTKGVEPNEFYAGLSRAKTAPCPAGPITVDTFRLFESLECGCVPIADTQTSNGDWTGFWDWLFDEPVPFPQIKDWSDVVGWVNDLSKQYPTKNNRVMAWWMRYKAKLVRQLELDLVVIGAPATTKQIMYVVPVSPIPSHPETTIIDETINSILFHDPHGKIMITFDGVRIEQEERRFDYEEHIRRVLWKYNRLSFGQVIPYIFDEHMHQSGMMRSVIDKIDTRLIMYMEQDAPLVIDYDIPIQRLSEYIREGYANVIRFHHEGQIPEEHKHLMIGTIEVDLLRTVQWSQRPHLASTAFYRRILSENFSIRSKCFLEDLIHGKVQDAWIADGIMGWDQWKLFIYHPAGGNIKRSYTTDGRAGGAKYDDSQIW